MLTLHFGKAYPPALGEAMRFVDEHRHWAAAVRHGVDARVVLHLGKDGRINGVIQNSFDQFDRVARRHRESDAGVTLIKPALPR